MPELLANSKLLFLPAMLPAILLLLAPLCGARVRMAFAAVLALAALAVCVDVLVLDHAGLNTLAVPNPFPADNAEGMQVWIVDTVTAPAWHWHLWVAGMLLLPAAWLFVRRRRAPSVPSPVLHCAGLFLYYLVLRIGLEKTAAPRELVWAVGATPATICMLPFFGYYCGRRGYGFRRFLGRLLAMAYAQRLPLTAIAFVATTQHLGSHLDTHVVDRITMPGAGEIALGSDLARWAAPTALPHLVMWVIMTMVAGLILGWPVCWLMQRRRREVAAAPAG